MKITNSPTYKLSQFIVHTVNENHGHITNLVLQKILYILQYEWIRYYKQPITSHQFEAWDFGPCLPDIYYAYCHHGAMPIWTLDGDTKPDISDRFTPEQIQSITDIALSHADKSPWEFEPQYFGEGSLFYRIRQNYKENINRYHPPVRNYNPPILTDQIEKDIESGCQYKDAIKTTNCNYNITFSIPSAIKYFIAPLIKYGFDYKIHGMQEMQELFQWTTQLDTFHSVKLSICTQHTNQPLVINLYLITIDYISHAETVNSLSETLTLQHDDCACNVTVK